MLLFKEKKKISRFNATNQEQSKYRSTRERHAGFKLVGTQKTDFNKRYPCHADSEQP
jgi:hypothetical protein